MSRAEWLFDRERNLRTAAVAFAEVKNEETRKTLRAAALAYADEANDLDTLLDPPEDR